MPALNSYCEKTRKEFHRIVLDEAANPNNLKCSNSDFSRNRILSLEDVALLPYQVDDRSINRCLPYLPRSLSAVSESAISQARQKISSSFYENVFVQFNASLDRTDRSTFKGFRIIAVDGSELRNPPDGKDMSTHGGSKKGGKHHFFHANPAYDVLSHQYVDVIIQPGSEKNEDKALLELVARNEYQDSIFTCDRGYEGLMTFYRLVQAGTKFVIRIKDEDSAISIVKHYPTPNTDEYDIPFNVTLTSKNNKHVKDNWDTYKYISSYPRHPEFTDRVAELPLHGRIVRFKAASEGHESIMTVFTNLKSEEFSTDEIKEIYRLRWQIEISFRDLKDKIGLHHIHARKKDLVIGEVYARMTIYNLFSRIRNAIERSARFQKIHEEVRKRKWKQKADFACLMAVVHKYLWDTDSYSTEELIGLLIRKRQCVRPGRADKRKLK